MFYSKGSWEDIDYRLSALREKLDVFPLHYSFSKEEWESMFDDIKELNEEFKTIRYPKKSDRDEAWEEFCGLRNKAYEVRQGQFSRVSGEHLRELERMSNGLMLPIFATTIADLFPDKMRELKEDMKENGRQLSKCFHHYNDVKQEMTKEDRITIRELLNEIKEDHDAFWGVVSHVHEERQQEWEDKRKERKEKIEENIRKNEEKLEKANDALERFESQRDSLKEKIDSAYSDRYKDQHEEWLDEVNDRISSVKDQIERLEQWIEEDEDKLRNL